MIFNPIFFASFMVLYKFSMRIVVIINVIMFHFVSAVGYCLQFIVHNVIIVRRTDPNGFK